MSTSAWASWPRVIREAVASGPQVDRERPWRPRERAGDVGEGGEPQSPPVAQLDAAEVAVGVGDSPAGERRREVVGHDARQRRGGGGSRQTAHAGTGGLHGRRTARRNSRMNTALVTGFGLVALKTPSRSLRSIAHKNISFKSAM